MAARAVVAGFVSGESEEVRMSKVTTWWREQYGKLPPAAQMIGLQLWMPLFFIIAFCLCYIGAFHSPQVHHIPVAVVNSPAAAVTMEKVEQHAPGTFDFSIYPDRDKAIDAVRDGSEAAALQLPADGQGKAEVFVASAHQYQSASMARQSLQQVFAAQNGITFTDIAPLPQSDAFGQGAMYMMLSWCIAGYMVAMFIGMMGAPLGHWMRLSILAGGAVVLSLVANLIVGAGFGVYDMSHFFQLVGLAFLWIFAIGLFVNGASYFFGRFITAPAMLLFIFLSMPASGAAFATWMIPDFFGFLQPFVVGHGITEMVKQILYGVGEPYWRGFLQMGIYALIGVACMIVGKRWRESKEVDRILAGKSTMMVAAQGAMMRQGMERRAATLRRHGIDPDTGKPLTAPAPSAEDATEQENAEPEPSGESADRQTAEFLAMDNSGPSDMMTNAGHSLGLGEIDREHDVQHAMGRHEAD